MSDPAAYTWVPPRSYVENARVTALARKHDVADFQALRDRSVADTAWYWDAVVKDLGLEFAAPYSRVLDLTNGIEHPDWFVEGRLNVVDSCLERWRNNEATAGVDAVVHETETGEVCRLTYRELTQQVESVSAGLKELGIQPGESVALYLPMIPEAVVAFYAIARIGAVAVPLFSGFAPGAISSRLQDAEAVAVVVANATIRRGRTIGLLANVEAALADCPTIRNVIEIQNVAMETAGQHTGVPSSSRPSHVPWSELLEAHSESAPPVHLGADAPLLLGYTSGTTGRPKGAVHTHAGFLVKTASEVAYSFDLGRGGVFTWVTDMGWIMGPLSIVGTHANGGTLLLYEGSPDVPDLHRLWQLIEKHGVTVLGLSPTLSRALRASRDPIDADLSSVHVIGSTGEPWDPGSYVWLAQGVFGGRVPIINFSGGTEVGGSFLAPYPVHEIRVCSLGGPSLGMDVDVVDASGNSVHEELGELVCRQPWPSMTRSIWKDDARYIESYWTTYPGMWHHGDSAIIDADGQWFIRGRSDDVMNIAGKRLSPAEVEGILTSHAAVADAAVIGVPHEVKGEAVWAFWVPAAGSDIPPDSAAEEEVSQQLRALVAQSLGKPFSPNAVHRVPALPKTRSGKTLRRAIRAVALGNDPGDLSGAENPEALDSIRKRLRGKPTPSRF